MHRREYRAVGRCSVLQPKILQTGGEVADRVQDEVDQPLRALNLVMRSREPRWEDGLRMLRVELNQRLPRFVELALAGAQVRPGLFELALDALQHLVEFVERGHDYRRPA